LSQFTLTASCYAESNRIYFLKNSSPIIKKEYNEEMLIKFPSGNPSLLFEAFGLSYFIIMIFFINKIYAKIIIYVVSEIVFFSILLRSFYEILITFSNNVLPSFHIFLIDLGFFLFLIQTYFIILFLKIERQNFIMLDKVERRREVSIKGILGRVSYLFISIVIHLLYVYGYLLFCHNLPASFFTYF